MNTLKELQNAVAGTQFANDMCISFNLNGKQTPRGYWNLIVSIRDCKLFSKGIKPTRSWKITNVKNYFGVKGNALQISETLETYKKILLNEK